MLDVELPYEPSLMASCWSVGRSVKSAGQLRFKRTYQSACSKGAQVIVEVALETYAKTISLFLVNIRACNLFAFKTKYKIEILPYLGQKYIMLAWDAYRVSHIPCQLGS